MSESVYLSVLRWSNSVNKLKNCCARYAVVIRLRLSVASTVRVNYDTP